MLLVFYLRPQVVQKQYPCSMADKKFVTMKNNEAVTTSVIVRTPCSIRIPPSCKIFIRPRTDLFIHINRTKYENSLFYPVSTVER